jgi:S1-C subfamily serine protease
LIGSPHLGRGVTVRNAKFAPLLVLSLLFPTPSSAWEIEQIQYNNWRGNALADDLTNSFVSCGIGSSFQNGTTFFINSFPGGQTQLNFFYPDWNLIPESNVNGILSIDNRYSTPFTGRATAPQMVSLLFGAGDAIFQSLRVGRTLSITSAIGTGEFDLTDTARALDVVRGCVEKYRTFVFRNPDVQAWLARNPWFYDAQPRLVPVQQRARQILREMRAEGVVSGVPNFIPEFDRRLQLAGIDFGRAVQNVQGAPAQQQPGPQPPQQATAPAQEEPKFATATGTGFVVSNDGHVMTNHHVIGECVPPIVLAAPGGDRYEAAVIARDELNDMALLRSEFRSGSIAAVRDSLLRTGEPVTVAGFPLAGYLASDLIVTTGIVSALGGLGDDTRFLQISAPVQPGNSGGPLFDQSGNVAGIVTSGANARYVAETAGSLPQNINFAIKGTLIRDFLDKNFVPYRMNQSRNEIRTAQIADQARAFTVQLLCRVPVPPESAQQAQ